MPNLNDGTDADREEFKANMSTQIPHVAENPTALWVEYQVRSQGTWVFVSASGEMERYHGSLGPQALHRRLLELLRDWKPHQ